MKLEPRVSRKMPSNGPVPLGQPSIRHFRSVSPMVLSLLPRVERETAARISEEIGNLMKEIETLVEEKTKESSDMSVLLREGERAGLVRHTERQRWARCGLFPTGAGRERGRGLRKQGPHRRLEVSFSSQPDPAPWTFVFPQGAPCCTTGSPWP